MIHNKFLIWRLCASWRKVAPDFWKAFLVPHFQVEWNEISQVSFSWLNITWYRFLIWRPRARWRKIAPEFLEIHLVARFWAESNEISQVSSVSKDSICAADFYLGPICASWRKVAPDFLIAFLIYHFRPEWIFDVIYVINQYRCSMQNIIDLSPMRDAPASARLRKLRGQIKIYAERLRVIAPEFLKPP